MTEPQSHELEFAELLDASCEDALTCESAARLEKIIRGNLEAQVRYLTYVSVDAALRWDHPAGMADPDDELAAAKALAAVNRPSHPPISVLGGIGYIQRVTYIGLAAAVLVSAGFFVGSLVFTSPSSQGPLRPTLAAKTNYVAKVTGLTGCRWADSQTATGYGGVPLGSKYALDSGLMEITYQSGAKVILEGPATFTVDSPDGGYLQIGKLTGKLEKTSAGRAHPFAIRTSVAKVTDFGTEFGLRVDAEGRSDVHVFDGSVKLESLSTEPRRTGAAAFVVSQGSAARAVPTGDLTLLSEAEAKATAATFTRRLTHRDFNVDLLDVVAGGDGSGWRREQGIDPITGKSVSEFPSRWRTAKAGYQRVPQQPLIDGVFVPDGGDQVAVTLDSAGHTSKSFPKFIGGTMGAIWARAASVSLDANDQQSGLWIYAMGAGAEYMPRNLGLLAMHPNSGITFDLAKIREARPGAKTVRFRATAGAPRNGLVDFWVFVDGDRRFERQKLQKRDGPVSVVVSLTAADRFLTLASTGAARGIDYVWLVLGDPVVELEGAKAK